MTQHRAKQAASFVPDDVDMARRALARDPDAFRRSCSGTTAAFIGSRGAFCVTAPMPKTLFRMLMCLLSLI